MGRIKSKKVKTKVKDILATRSDSFTTDFDENKKAIKTIADIPSKKLRNVLIGFLTREKRKSESKN